MNIASVMLIKLLSVFVINVCVVCASRASCLCMILQVKSRLKILEIGYAILTT